MTSNKGENFCLRWNDFENNISSSFRELRDDKDFFDITLVCDDNQLEAHKVILSACSPFFRTVLKKNPHQRPLLYLKGVNYRELLSVLNFMYHGEVNIAQDDLNTFLSVAEDLQVKGLTQGQTNNQAKHSSQSLKTNHDDRCGPAQPALNINQTLQSNHKTFHGNSTESSHKNIRGRDVPQNTTQIKTEAAPVYHAENEIVENNDLSVDHGEYEYDQSYQDDTTMYQGQEQNMHMAQALDNLQDPYAHIKEYVVKVPNENGFSCTICGKKCRDMYLMREHIEGLHDLSPGYLCGVCNHQCKNHKGLKVHMKKFHRN